MIEVKDEILNGDPKYRISDNKGNVLYDNVNIEMTTEVLQDGTPVNKALFDKIKSFLVPSGLISMWSGSVVPKGWFLCDGENGTPDLRNRFIVGAGSEYSIGDVGGEKTHTLTVEEMPSHNHKFQYANKQSNNLKDGNCLSAPDAGYWEYNTDVYKITTQNEGGGKEHENRPPYYALAYIMKG